MSCFGPLGFFVSNSWLAPVAVGHAGPDLHFTAIARFVEQGVDESLGHKGTLRAQPGWVGLGAKARWSTLAHLALRETGVPPWGAQPQRGKPACRSGRWARGPGDDRMGPE